MTESTSCQAATGVDRRTRWPLRLGARARAAGRTATFFLEVLPMLPSRPVDWITPQPVIDKVCYPTLHGPVAGQLYRPGTPGPHPGMVVSLGVVPFGVDHPQVPRLGNALARAGFAALLYWSPAMRDERLDPSDVANIALAYEWLIGQPFIDAKRSGLLGTCVGGAFALMAAAEPMIRDRVTFVTAWAPYASMRTLARDVASSSIATDQGLTAPWAVDPLTRRVFVRTLTALLGPDDAQRLLDWEEGQAAQPDSSDLAPDSRTVVPLLTALDPEKAEDTVAHLPTHMLERLDAMSPVHCVRDIRAPLIVLAHDRGDHVIPIGESRRLVQALRDHPGVRYTEFVMFEHLDPANVRLPPIALARELVKFVHVVHPIFRQSVAT